ncbi:MAG: alcohol dehydrogenase [Pedosphaera sp.]|nr:alcohol dehydrogenase [Pedosphaera sp.]
MRQLHIHGNSRQRPFRRAGYYLILIAALSQLMGTIEASDWPQFLGPARDGIYAGGDLARVWPKEGPPKIWEKKIGQGFSGPVVADGKLILFHRLGDQETIHCFDAKKGNQLWTFQYATTYRDDFGSDEGPRATPTIADGKVFTFGAEGALHCLDLATGKKIWSAHAKDQFASPKGYFGMACSPLVEGNHLLLNIGGENGSGIVAFDKNTGKLAWKATDHAAGYSSPVSTTIHGARHALFFTRSGLVLLDPEKGKLQSEFPFRARMQASVNAATPLVIDDLIFLSASYQVGAVVLALKEGNKLQKLWASDDSLSNHYATSVHQAGFLYGFHGRQEEGPSLRCVELKTGKVRWTHHHIPAGTIILADGFLLLVLEDGRLMLAPASTDGFKPVAEAQVLSHGVRAHPALANGNLYARSKDKLVCLDLGKR